MQCNLGTRAAQQYYNNAKELWSQTSVYNTTLKLHVLVYTKNMVSNCSIQQSTRTAQRNEYSSGWEFMEFS